MVIVVEEPQMMYLGVELQTIAAVYVRVETLDTMQTAMILDVAVS